jgi:hypothetical protein
MGRIITLSMAVLMTIGGIGVLRSVPKFNEWLDSGKANQNDAIIASGDVDTLKKIARRRTAQRAEYIDDYESEQMDRARGNSYYLLR